MNPAAVFCRCGRLDTHDPHEWRGHKRYDHTLRQWIKPFYWCAGYVITEGGNGVH